ncbi:MAG: tRNA uridine-5-carboxymethylaminomethyl(34) synthesis GTPase MnmE [Hyphomicrobiales bacterium]|nr:tRNA uridine-5-carboxymethylaminomethyl(34) synthesis GTPase MnmE [Hyphomicrobiales bacterium]
MSDTIYALSSAQRRAGVAVVRLSGPAVRDVFQTMCGKVPTARIATLMTVRHPIDGITIDKGLCLWFAAPRSFTGEDMGEFQLHGGPAVILRLLGAFSGVDGLRPAEPGEFTRRAFVNGKLDLVEVEALGDVISAETEGQLRLAQRLAGGALSNRVSCWRKALVSARSAVEAAIDFSDEGDVRTDVRSEVELPIRQVLRDIEAVLDDGGRGERLRDGLTVAIAGPPNAGKSTLLNLLARREAAIVSPFAGTTRDPVEVHLDLGGVPVTLVDTAGLRDGGDEVEAIGVARARERVAKSDLVLWLEPAMDLGEASAEAPPECLRVTTKLDLAPKSLTPPGLAISAVTGVGLPELMGLLVQRARELAGAQENVLIARARQRAALHACAEELKALLKLADGKKGAALEFQAEHLRRAMRELGRLIGQVDVEEVLGEIFAAFCIGK